MSSSVLILSTSTTAKVSRKLSWLFLIYIWHLVAICTTPRHVYDFIVATVLHKIVTMWAHSFTETGSIAITRWFAPEGKKPSQFPSKSSFPFFGVEPVLVEKSSMVCRLNLRPSIYIDDLILQLECQLLGQTLSSGVYICNYKLPTNKQDNNEVQGRLFLKKPLPGMGRKANGSHEEFNQIYFQNPKGKGLHITTEMDTYSSLSFLSCNLPS